MNSIGLACHEFFPISSWPVAAAFMNFSYFRTAEAAPETTTGQAASFVANTCHNKHSETNTSCNDLDIFSLYPPPNFQLLSIFTHSDSLLASNFLPLPPDPPHFFLPHLFL
jgi:hypothetical protein